MSTSALIVVDFQNDFVTGSLPVPGAKDAVSYTNNVIDLFMEAGLPVIYTQDFHPEETPHFDVWPKHCVQGTDGAAMYPGIIFPPANYSPLGILRKGLGQDHGYSGFSEPADGTLYMEEETLKYVELHHMLIGLGVETLVICGLALDHCVVATAVDALNLGYNVLVLTSATASVDQSKGIDAMQDILNAGGQVQDGPFLLNP